MAGMSLPERILFYQYGTTLWLADDESLMLDVLVGRVGQWGVTFALNDQERAEYRQRGDDFIKELSDKVFENEASYAARGHRRS